MSVYQVKAGFVDARGNYWENVLHFNNNEATIDQPYSAALDLCSSFDTTMHTTLMALLGTDVKLNILSAKKLDDPGGPTAFTPVNRSGTGSTPSVSPAFAADFQVIPGGLKNRAGHIFMSGIFQAAIQGSIYQAAFETASTAFFAALLAFTTTTGGNDVSYGTYTKSTKTVTTATFLGLNIKVTGMNKRTLPVT